VRAWAMAAGLKIGLFVLRKYCIRVLDDTIQYDLTDRDGPTIKMTRLEDESFDDCQKRLLLYLNSKLDIVRMDNATKFGIKGDDVYATPRDRTSVMTATNMYRMIIPGLPDQWLPMATLRPNIHPIIANILWKFDLERFAKYGYLQLDQRQVCPHNHLVSGYIRVDVGVPPLMILCLRRLSAYNLAYGGSSKYPYVANACFNPLLGLGDKLSRLPKSYVSFLPEFRFQDVHRAINYYYMYCVKVQKFKFTFDPSDLDLFKFGNTKCGYRKWQQLQDLQLDKFTRVKFTHKPSKRQAQVTIMREFLQAIFKAFDETTCGSVPFEKYLKQFITTLSIKEQNLSAIDLGLLTDDAVKDMYWKSRLFFLSNDSALHKLFLTRVKGERSYFPDCKDILGVKDARHNTLMISIGMTWTRGGAELLFNSLHGDRFDVYERVSFAGDSASNVCCTYKWKAHGDMLIGSGDIKSLDTSITAIPLVLYLMFAQIWIQRNDSDPSYRMFQYILEGCAEQLAGKTVRWIKDFVLLIGVMPSGSLETSHGDSWVVGVVYWLSYIFNVMAHSEVKVRRQIWEALANRIIGMFVYGDDFLKVYPKSLRDHINVNGFAGYMLSSHSIQFKNSEEFSSALTYLTVWNNEVVNHVYTGPSYLKRHLIRADQFNLNLINPKISKVVPWRPFPQYQWRAGVPRDRSAPIYMNLSRLIGLAYDTLGVDPMAYYYLGFVYNDTYEISARIVGANYLTDNMPRWLEEDCKYLRKINYRIEHSNFPSREELLDLCVMKREYHYPPTVGPWQMHLQDYEWW
jgi:hypothetical protein